MCIKVFIILILLFITSSFCSGYAEEISAVKLVNSQIDNDKPSLRFLPNYSQNSRVFLGAKINPYYKIDCKEAGISYDPYYCGLRNLPEVVRFSTPRAGITFTF